MSFAGLGTEEMGRILARAAQAACRVHRRYGVAWVVSEDGQTVEISPWDVPLPGDNPETLARGRRLYAEIKRVETRLYGGMDPESAARARGAIARRVPEDEMDPLGERILRELTAELAG